MLRKAVVSVQELQYVSVCCQHCNTTVVVDLSSEDRTVVRFPNAGFISEQCPGCGTKYDSALQMGLKSVESAYKSLLPFAKYIGFHISLEELP